MATPQPPRDHRVPLDAAARYTAAYRRGRPQDPAHAFRFDRAAYDAILAQAGCVGVRTYLGRHDDGSLTAVLVGVDAEGNDMTSGALMQEPDICPPDCPTAASPLNGNG
jgi:hypothetical protein